MHELSIAKSILELARRHVPEGGVLREVKVRIGPMRGIDPESLALAWQASTEDTDAADVKLQPEYTPWSLKCPQCQTVFTSDSPTHPCACGSDQAYPVRGDELMLISILVDEPSLAGGAP